MKRYDKNYYKILQIDNTACEEVVEAAFKGLGKLYHPDVNQGKDTTETMKTINEAYSVLTKDRKEYDQYYDKVYVRREPPPPGPTKAPPPKPKNEPIYDPEDWASSWEKMNHTWEKRHGKKETHNFTHNNIVAKLFRKIPSAYRIYEGSREEDILASIDKILFVLEHYKSECERLNPRRNRRPF